MNAQLETQNQRPETHLPIPLTLVTGYLGAGKTTLLRRIVVDSNDKRLAILMNEFGDIAIDSKLVKGKNIEIVELAGGCVCCSLAGEFEFAVKEILETIKPNWIVIETTGVAEPSALAYDIIENIEGVRLDGLVTVVDADAMIRFPNLGHTGREQIELADLILINKTDLAGPLATSTVRIALQKLNPKAKIIECSNCDIKISLLTGISRSISRSSLASHTHEAEESEFTFEMGQASKFDHEKFIRFLESLPKCSPDIYRAKGFVRTERGQFLMNYVAGRISIEAFKCEKTELVFIGKRILKDKKEIVRCLADTIDAK